MRKILASILLIGIALLAGSGCGRQDSSEGQDSALAAEEQAEENTIRIFDKNIDGESFDDAVAEKIMEATGVKVVIEDATDNPEEKLELMLRNQEYPDIILMEQGDMVNRFIEAGALVHLDSLIEQYGEHIQEMYGDILDRSAYSNGHIYWLANWYGTDYDASAGVLMRKDILTELAGEERANSREPFTLSEYTELLRSFKERYPTIEDQDSIALELDSDSENYKTTMNAIYGLKTYEEDSEGNLHYLATSDRYEEAMLYVNELYREGLLDKEWVINKQGRWEDKLASGIVFSTWGSYWDTDKVNEELAESLGEDAQFYCYKVVADDLQEDQTTYNARNSLGWDAIAISSQCRNQEAAIRLLDYLASEEGQYLMLWGLEGEEWHMENGQHVPEDDFLTRWQINSQETEQETGVRRWTWMIKNGNGSDGTPYDLTTKYVPSPTVKFANETFGPSDYWDTAIYSGLEPTMQSSLGLTWEEIQDVYEQDYAGILTASTEEEAVRLYQNMIQEMEFLNLDQCETYITNQYKIRLKRWGSQ